VVSDGEVKGVGPKALDPGAYEEALLPVVREVALLPRFDRDALHQILRDSPKDGKGFFSRADLIAGFRAYSKHIDFGIDERQFIARLRRKPVRTQSGVTPVTVLSKPFPCPGECIFCPSDVRMPKSYLRSEPGAQRAALNAFDPYAQVRTRIAAFYQLGHPIDKIELIILGGTWSFYPDSYQIWFVKRCFEAMNDVGRMGHSGRVASRATGDDFGRLGSEIRGHIKSHTYNHIVSSHLRSTLDGDLIATFERAEFQELALAQAENENSACRNVGLVVETRPDFVDEAEVERMRRLGVTKVQIGLQSLSDEVLQKNKRGHGLAEARRAIELLRRAGFKLHAHWMPNLYGSDVARDLADFERLFGDLSIRPDELKLYPCSLVSSAELMREYESGGWAPYSHEELVALLVECLAKTPAYCRLSRIVRDIPSPDIVVGNKLTNLREVAEQTLRQQGKSSLDIRSREIRGEAFDLDCLRPEDLRYETSVGEEHFLQIVTEDGLLVAFLRLFLPKEASYLDELGASAIIREVHVYGASAELGERNAQKPQHLGLGRELLSWAERVASAAGFDRLAVISAVGTRAYYRKRGFSDGRLYQHRVLRER